MCCPPHPDLFGLLSEAVLHRLRVHTFPLSSNAAKHISSPIQYLVQSVSKSFLLTNVFTRLFCNTADLQEALVFRKVSQHSQFQLRVISRQYHPT